jgi:hypothetical protein
VCDLVGVALIVAADVVVFDEGTGAVPFFVI